MYYNVQRISTLLYVLEAQCEDGSFLLHWDNGNCEVEGRFMGSQQKQGRGITITATAAGISLKGIRIRCLLHASTCSQQPSLSSKSVSWATLKAATTCTTPNVQVAGPKLYKMSLNQLSPLANKAHCDVWKGTLTHWHSDRVRSCAIWIVRSDLLFRSIQSQKSENLKCISMESNLTLCSPKRVSRFQSATKHTNDHLIHYSGFKDQRETAKSCPLLKSGKFDLQDAGKHVVLKKKSLRFLVWYTKAQKPIQLWREVVLCIFPDHHSYIPVQNVLDKTNHNWLAARFFPETAPGSAWWPLAVS